MFNSISDFLQSDTKTNGLFLIDPSTGIGKTYQSCQAIYDYVYKKHGSSKIYFTTTLLKNLPVDELRKTYERNKNVNFEKDVLVIKSNGDFVKANFLNVKIPEEYQSEEYKTLQPLVQKVNDKSFAKSEQIYKEEIEKRFDNAEYAFRKYLRKLITVKIPGSVEEKKRVLRNDRRYNWIGKIYPTVFTDEYKIYFLSVNKLLTRNDTLIKPSCPFISVENLKNTIVFIDEFDATKETIKENIITEAVNTQNNYLDIVKELHSKLQGQNYKPAKSFYEPYHKYTEKNKNALTLEKLKTEIDSIYEKYAMFFNYKTNGNSVDRNRGFLFFDGSFRSFLKDNRYYIRTVIGDEEQQVKIYFENKDEYNQNKNPDTDINIYSLLREITAFLNTFARFIASWATQYAKYENEKRKQEDEHSSNIETFTFENAVETICDVFLRDGDLRGVLFNLVNANAMRNISYSNSVIEDYSFFNRGFKFFEFIDSDSHNEETKIHFIQVNSTPEKILLFMSKNCKVVGLSATAKIDSILSNYSLSYLKEELKENYVDFPESSYEKLISEQNKKWQKYTDGTIKISVKSVDEGKENKPLKERLSFITENKDLEKNFLLKLNNLDLNENNKVYYQNRYCNIFEVLKSFIEDEEIKSFLCLNMALPKENCAPFDIGLLKEFVSQYCEIHQKESSQIKVLSSKNYEEEKDKILDEFSEGKKIIVFSSYKTVGAGQNLQYKIPENEKDKIITLSNQNKTSEKDFDALYLGDITNVITNTTDVQNFGLKELLEFLFEAKYLYENNEISPRNLNQLVQVAFKAYSKIPDYATSLDYIRSCASVRRKATRDVIQAVGRICRTSNKKETVYIYTNNSVLTTINVNCVNNELMPPELKSLFDFAGKYSQKLPDEKVLIENEACRKSENANSYIKSMLQRNWTEHSIQLWKELRECVLKYPTASKETAENNKTVSKFYIQNYEQKSNYYFAQKGDFSDIRINLFQDYSVFKKELDSDFTLMNVSEESARLKAFFVYAGLREYFEQNGFAINFGNEDFILSPALFNNIYKGALGEVCGKFILEKELNTKLYEIENHDYFEFFDFELADGIFIDFKHWKNSIVTSKNSLIRQMENKLNAIGGKKVYVINILKEAEALDIVQTENVIEIPWLVDENGKPNEKAIKMLIGDLHDGNIQE